MIQIFNEFKNIGRFHEDKCSVELEEFNLFFAENGCGKTTLAAVLQSISEEEPGFITERSTVGNDYSPFAKLSLENGDVLCFNNGVWHGPSEEVNIRVFDAHFVNTRVHAGHTLSNNHKKKLHSFILGKKGEEYLSRIDRLNYLSRDFAAYIRELKAKIEAKIESDDFSLEDIKDLPDDDNLEAKIEQTAESIKSIQNRKSIQEKETLSSVHLPEIPFQEIDDILGLTIDGVSEKAELIVKTHIERCMDEEGENWIESGLSYVDESNCPFCGQDLTGINLIEAYKDYFNQEYEELKERSRKLSQRVESQLLPQEGWQAKASVVQQNSSIYKEWDKRIDAAHEVPSDMKEEIESVWKACRDSLGALLKKKQEAPLEHFELNEAAELARSSYNSLANDLSQYNCTVDEVNESINAFRSGLDSESLSDLKTRLARLKDQKFKYSEEGQDLLTRLRANRKRKRDISNEKEATKDKLEDYQRGVLDNCQKHINDFLRKAGADFEICDTDVGYQGGSASTQYSIRLNGEKIKLGTGGSEIGEYAFRNLLSDGDKNTLAFAFFYATVKNIPDLSDYVLVVDDPISSLDAHRRSATRGAIMELASEANQTLLMSHSPRFLDRTWRKVKSDHESKLFKIKQTGDKTSAITTWSEDDMRTDLQDKYFYDFEKLRAFAEEREGNVREIPITIRRILESNLRRRFPDKFEQRESNSLSHFINLVNKAEPTNPLAALQGTKEFTELEEIVTSEYCHEPHHTSDPIPSRPINQRELANFAQRTITFARGFAG